MKNRTIKFRVCSHSDKKCYQPLSLDEINESVSQFKDQKDDFSQFTGLTEFYPNQTEAREIYEGDTILTNGRLVTVTYENGQFLPREIYLQAQYNKIVGNIYESATE